MSPFLFSCQFMSVNLLIYSQRSQKRQLVGKTGLGARVASSDDDE